MLTKKRRMFDFRTILYLNILLMFFLIVSGSEAVLLCSFVLSAVVLADTGAWRRTVKYSVGFAALAAVQYALGMTLAMGVQNAVVFLVQMVLFLALRVYPFVGLGFALKEGKNIAEITTALDRLHLHRGVVLSIVVMIRYLPAMAADFRVILDAMRLRGIPISLKFVALHPMKAIEYLIVPMLFRSEKITEEFSGAALVKGYAFGTRRTSYFDVRLAAKDAAMLAASTASLVLCAFV
ncbi:energy-coupling factor transporter transmembrane component T [Selenomonas sp.]|uniref:energy-coupling factor transporter transmembrane component T n=1 Tax=Selenomonas sp. TaxID=2053611 RepID=UPI003FA1BA50